MITSAISPIATGSRGVWRLAAPRAISASSDDPPCTRASAGGGWQGRRSAGIPLGFQGSRTPPGGDQRSIRGCGGSPEGALGGRLLGRGLLVAGDVADHGLPARVRLVVRLALLRLARRGRVRVRVGVQVVVDRRAVGGLRGGAAL